MAEVTGGDKTADTAGDHPEGHAAPVARRRVAGAYALGVLVPAAAVVALLVGVGVGVGVGGSDPGPAGATGPVPAAAFDVQRILLTLAIVIAAAHLGGALAARLRQPRVIGQAAVGLLLGPSALGQVAPGAEYWLKGGGTSGVIDLLAQLGVVLFVFLVGRELAGAHSRRTGAALVVGQVMVAVPLLCGVLVAVLLLRPPVGVAPLPHALFIGLAMSATALPVLAHILAERRLLTSRVGSTGTAAAAVGDATVWCLLAVTVSLLQHGDLLDTGLRLGTALLLAAVVWWLVRPLAGRVLAPARDSRYTAPALLLCSVLACAVATERLGLHALFGAFVAGLAMPASSPIVLRVSVVTEGMTEWLLLPLFFTAIGSRIHLELLTEASDLWLCLVVLVVGTASKLLSAAVAGRAVGFGWRDSAALGVMMNCRGMTELVLLNLGLGAGVLDERTFAVFVIMTLVTTAATGPLMDWLGVRRSTATPVENAGPVMMESRVG